MVGGTRADADALWVEVADVLSPMGLRLPEEKTRVCSIDEGLDFLGWHIQRRRKRGHDGKRAVYAYPSKKALLSVTGKVRSLTRRHKHRTLADLLLAVNRVLRRWCNYFRYGVSSATFGYPATSRGTGSMGGCATTRRAEHDNATPPSPSKLGDPRRQPGVVPAAINSHRALPISG